MNVAKQYGNVIGLIGGFHSFHNFFAVEDLDFICPCHCTTYKKNLQKKFPDKFSICGVGKKIDLQVQSRECKWFQVCPMKRYYEEGLLNKRWIELYCKGDWKSCVRYEMEENSEPHADYLLPDGSIDKELEKKRR